MGIAALEALDSTIDELLAADPDDLTDTELHELVVGLHRCSHRLAAARARHTGPWDRRHVWTDDGSRSAGARLAREAGMRKTSADTEIRHARHLATMPDTEASLAAGTISPDHVELLGRANSGERRALFADHEEMLVEQCQRLRFADAYRAVEYWTQRADAQAAEREGEQKANAAELSAATALDGMVHLHGLLDPIGGAAFLNELERLEREQYLADHHAGTERSGGQRRAAALVEMAHRSRTAAPGGLRPRPLITLLVGYETFAGRICELAEGIVVAPGQIVPYLADADIERVVFDGPNRVISVSRRRRFTGALRRAIEVRDRHCQHPSGCDVRAAKCDVDHTVPYSEGGITSQDGGKLGCWTHNRIPARRNRQPKPPSPAGGPDPGATGTDADGDGQPPDERPPPAEP
jgi:hypothetical protein